MCEVRTKIETRNDGPAAPLLAPQHLGMFVANGRSLPPGLAGQGPPRDVEVDAIIKGPHVGEAFPTWSADVFPWEFAYWFCCCFRAFYEEQDSINNALANSWKTAISTWQNFAGDTTTPTWVEFHYDDGSIYFFRGTSNAIQWVQNIAGWPFQASPGGVGQVHGGFLNAANPPWARIQQQMQTNQRPVIFAGHSLGAAVATIIAARAKASFPHLVRGVLNIGSPKVGNSVFSTSINFPHHRLKNDGDPVCDVLSQSVIGLGGLPNEVMWLAAPNDYTHVGTGWILGTDGTLRRETTWTDSNVALNGFAANLIRMFSSGGYPHIIQSYVLRMNLLRRNLPVGEQGILHWKTPWVVHDWTTRLPSDTF